MVHRIAVSLAFMGVGALVLLAGCQSVPKEEQPLLVFPSPPANPRVQFLTWASGAAQVEEAKSSFESFLLGEEPSMQRNINKPYGIAARDGVVYVCDTKGLSVCKLDFKNRRYSLLGLRGPGRLRKPINIAVDSLGYKFVADPLRKQVVVFGPEDKYVSAFDVPKPCHPVDVAVYEEELYVLDNDTTCQIVVMDRQTGRVIRTLGSSGDKPGQFAIPNSLAIGPEGYLYVSDTHNFRVQKLTRAGESVWVKGTAGYRLGQFGRPRGLRVGPNGIAYVVDGATEIVQMFNDQGRILMHFGGPGDMPGALVLPSTLAVDATSLPYFEQYIHPDFDAKYLMFVVSQYGRFMVNIYAFGSFPEGYTLAESQIARLPKPPPESGVGAVDDLATQPTTQPTTQPAEASESPEAAPHD